MVKFRSPGKGPTKSNPHCNKVVIHVAAAIHVRWTKVFTLAVLGESGPSGETMVQEGSGEERSILNDCTVPVE